VAKPNCIELPGEASIPILYEDRAVLAIDKPAWWMLIPYSWQKTDRNLQAALVSSIAANHFWARSRGLKFLKHIHRLDAETTGILLFAKSRGALDSYSSLFELRQMKKVYLVVVQGIPREKSWTCQAKLAPDPSLIGRMKVDAQAGNDAQTSFRLVETIGVTGAKPRSLLEAHPLTGRTHQIRLHCVEGGHPVVGDQMYGAADRDGADRNSPREFPMALRAVALSYADPFTRRQVCIEAPSRGFTTAYGFREVAGFSGGSAGRRVHTPGE